MASIASSENRTMSLIKLPSLLEQNFSNQGEQQSNQLIRFFNESLKEDKELYHFYKKYSKMNTVFTIEQVDLIRRLRRTGIRLDNLIYAFKEMDRLERENCQQHTQSKANNPLNSFTTIAASFNNSLEHGNGSGPLSHLSNNSNNNSINSGQQLQLDPLSSLNSDTLGYEQNLSNVSNAGNNSNLFGMSLQPSTSKINDSGDLHNNIMHKYALQPIMIPNSLNDEQNELVEFKKKGENAMLMEIRTSVAKYNIRQSMLSEMIGISQGYISRFFRGEGQDISERAKNLIYSWYLNFRRNPMKILQSCPISVGDRKMISESGDLLPIRRDRFIFRKQHLAVLESYFNQNQYPDTHTKEQIADECNQAAERLSTRPLSEKDKVTTSIVSNWFNNKRKDTKMTRQSQGNILNNQQQNSDSNPSPLALSNTSQNNSAANSSANNSNNGTQQTDNGSNGSENQQNQSGSQATGQNSQENYYYRDTQPLKLETYPDIGQIQCYQTMEDEESEPEIE